LSKNKSKGVEMRVLFDYTQLVGQEIEAFMENFPGNNTIENIILLDRLIFERRLESLIKKQREERKKDLDSISDLVPILLGES
jgi:hypothetical protein